MAYDGAAKDEGETKAEKPARPRLTEADLKTIISAQLANCVGMDAADEIASDRADALDRYFAEEYGDEVDGESKVIMPTVRDTIEWAMPGLIKPIVAGKEWARFSPSGPEDEKVADQATDYVNYVVQKDNRGFLIIHDMLKDGLLSKTGTVAVYPEKKTKSRTVTYKGLTEDDVAELEKIEGLEFVEFEEKPVLMGALGPNPAMSLSPGVEAPQAVVYDAKVKITKEETRICIMPIPPEDWLVSRRASDPDKAPLVGHRVRRTVSDLVDEGYDIETIKRGAGLSASEIRQERNARFPDQSWIIDGLSKDESQTEVEEYTLYLKVDWDGDGVAELRCIKGIGFGDNGAGEILENDEASEHPYAWWSPIRVPHALHGLSLADLVIDLQLILSTLWRQLLNNTYLINNAVTEVPESAIGENTIDDLLTKRPGSIVRTKTPGQLLELRPNSLARELIPVIEAVMGQTENRTGITRYNQGMDADSLNKTASGINQIMSAAQSRMELILRMFAETGLKDLMRKVYKASIEYQDKPRVIKLRNEWVPIDPRSWDPEMDVSIEVGLGYGSQEMQAAMMDRLAQMQAAVIKMGGLDKLVTLKNIYNTLTKGAKYLGIKDPDAHWTDPDEAAQRQAQQPPKPDPEMVKVQQQGAIKQAEIQQKGELKREEMAQDAQLEREGMAAEAALQQRQQDMDQQARMEEGANELMLALTGQRADAAIQTRQQDLAASQPQSVT